MPQVIDEYVQWMRAWGASEQTIRARQKMAMSRIQAWGLDGFTVKRIQQWLGRPELRSQWSRTTYHAHLSSFCAWAEAAGHMAANPMPDIPKGRRPQPSPRPLSESEVARVLAVAEGRVRDWILLALLAGLRAHEVAKIRGEDVTPEGIYVEGKGGTRCTIPTHPDLWQMAQRYPRHGYWFPSRSGIAHVTPATVTNYVGALFDGLGIHGSIHRARHTYGTRLLRAGVNIRKVQTLMRHANLETTATYTAVDEDELREAIGLLRGA